MHIDPEAEIFGEIKESTPESEELFKKLVEEGKIVAMANDTSPLKKLQDDLRKAGYNKVK